VIVDINGREFVVDRDVTTVGSLVDRVETQIAPCGEVVTAVRLDGVEETDYRTPGVANRPLASLRAVSIESDTPDALARGCVGDAALALDDLIQATQQAADGFRGVDVSAARCTLGQISQNILGVVRIVATAHVALQGELDAVGRGDRSLAALALNLDRIVGALSRSQEDEDWIQVSDILQYELVPALASWQSTLSEVAAG